MWKAAVVLLLFCASASRASAENVRLPLMHEPARAVSGVSEFTIALPRHVAVQPGSQLTLVLHLRVPPGPVREPLSININGQDLQPRFTADAPSFALRIEAELPESLLQAGWNRLVATLPQQLGTCEVRRAESHLALNFERLPLFPELRRFPESLTEEKLLRPYPTNEVSSPPTVSMLLPAARRDVHLHACAILGARLGQQNYFSESDFDLLEIANWPSAENRHAVIIGRTDELGNLPFLAELSQKLSALGKGQGLLAEFVLGDFPNQRRWIVATGADDAGLEAALLTLGSRPALNTLSPSPVEITAAPEVTLQMELLARPSRSQNTFKDLGWREIEVGHWPEQRFGWRLPPGYTVASGELIVNFFHPKESQGGSLAVFLGATELGHVALTPENAEAGSVTFPLPEGLPGSDPAMFTFRATTTNAQHRGKIAVVLGNSALETIIEPVRIAGLQHLDSLLLRDAFLRRTAFVLPGQPTLAEMKVVADLAMHLGRQLPSSPVLWPEACTFDVNRPPAPECIKGRSAVVLAPVSAWRSAVPPKTRLPIEPLGHETVNIQGRRNRISDFEPNLTLIQMARAPWSDDEWVVMAGGWQSMDLGATKRLITSTASEGTIYGNMAAVDGRGRFAAHDSREPSIEYFGQRLRQRVPAGLTVEQTASRLREASTRREQSLFVNRFLIWFVGIFIGLIVLGRLVLVWERARQYRKTTENPVGNAP
jgi:hypothetical protein